MNKEANVSYLSDYRHDPFANQWHTEGNTALMPEPDNEERSIDQHLAQVTYVDFSAKRKINTKKHLAEVAALQRIWDDEISSTKEDGEFDQYNPVLVRWGWERTKTEKEHEQFKQAEIINIKTSLRGRYHTERSEGRLSFDEKGRVRNDAYLKEPWEDVLERGVDYRKEQGSRETEREESEKNGFLKIQEKFSNPNTEIGSMAVIISPPGIVEGTIYDHDFVDVYQLVKDQDTGKRFIQYTRFSSPLDYESYKDIAETIDPAYFKKEDVEDENSAQEEKTTKEVPLDAWYLGRPFFISPESKCNNADDVFAEYFEKDCQAMEDEQFEEEVWKVALPYVLFYVSELTKPNFNPHKIVKAWNTIHHSLENEQMQEKIKEVTIFVPSNKTQLDTEEDMYQKIAGLVNQFGFEAVKEVKAGCGNSGGFIIKGESRFTDLPTANSVAQFGGGGEEKYTGENAKNDPNLCRCPQGEGAHFHCDGKGGECNKAITVGEGITECPGCGKGKAC